MFVRMMRCTGWLSHLVLKLTYSMPSVEGKSVEMLQSLGSYWSVTLWFFHVLKITFPGVVMSMSQTVINICCNELGFWFSA